MEDLLHKPLDAPHKMREQQKEAEFEEYKKRGIIYLTHENKWL